MKPLYWKFLLILGAVIVSASLVVPKALRKNTTHGANNVSQTLFVSDLNQDSSFEVNEAQEESATVIFGKVKYLPYVNISNIIRFGFGATLSAITNVNTPTHSLNAGTRPTKSRVVG